MKHGYRILIHKSLKDDLYKVAVGICESLVERFNSPNGYKSRSQSRAYYGRGILGLTFKELPGYSFKRLSKNRRVFGIIPISLLEGDINLNQCMCARHLGGTKVTINGGLIETDYIKHYEIGEIKG